MRIATGPTRKRALGEIAQFERDVVQPNSIGADSLYLGLEHLTAEGAILGPISVSKGDLASAKFRFTSQHVLYGKLRPYLRKVVRPTFDGICSTDIMPIRPGPELDRGYLYHWLRTPRVVALAEARSSGANLPRISPTIMRGFEIPLPELEEQKLIAQTLDKTEQIRRQIDELGEYGEKVIQSHFHTLFGSSRDFGRTWPLRTVDDVVEEIIDYRGKTPAKAQGGIPLVTARVVKNGSVQEPDEFISASTYAVWMRRGFPRVGDVVFTTEAPLGQVAILQRDDVALAQRIVLLRPRLDIVRSEYLSFALRSPFAISGILRRATGSTVKGIRQSELRKVPVPVPPIDLQIKFGEFYLAARNLCAGINDCSETAERFFQAVEAAVFIQ